MTSHSLEYRKTYLGALAAVMARAVPQHLLQTAPMEEPVLPECLNLLLADLEGQRYGSELLSQALYATGLLLSQWPDSRLDVY